MVFFSCKRKESMAEITTTGDKRRQKKKKTKSKVPSKRPKVDLCKDTTGFSKVACKVEELISNFEDIQNTLFVVGLVVLLLLAPIIFFVMKARKNA